MALDSLESGPERIGTAIGDQYRETLEFYGGEFDAAVLGIESQERALIFVLGRLEDCEINHGNKEALGIVRCEITNALMSIEDLEERGYTRQNVWEPALDAVKFEKESFGGFQRMRQAVNLYNSAEVSLMLGALERISRDFDQGR